MGSGCCAGADGHYRCYCLAHRLSAHARLHYGSNPRRSICGVQQMKTTIEVPETLWNAFAIESIKREKRSGTRNAIICKMIALYNDGKLQVKA